MLSWAAATGFGLAVGRMGFGQQPPAAPPRVLFFTKSAGFEHSVVKRERADEPALAEKLVTEWFGGDARVTCTKDGGVFTRDGLAACDVVIFCTTGDLTQAGTDGQPPVSAEGKRALLDAVARGDVGFVGVHCASDTWRGNGPDGRPDPYVQMLGGRFVAHGAQQRATMRVVDRAFPGAPPADVTLHEEWYAMDVVADDLHVIGVQETKGMDGVMYRRAPYPLTWARMHGRGRVFYTALGHREDVWTNPMFTAMLAGAVQWAAGRAEADVTPNLAVQRGREKE
ncbi:MAG TPA: ThuA domain-containing protein [Tepidisphaeraceae bacterium]|nr:ThuA domain-containing protein [Tepidisphaeraceae bacterium]